MGTPINTDRIHRLLLPGLNLDWFLVWPPDTFGLTSMLLHHSECFRKVVSPDASRHWPPSDQWVDNVHASAEEWRAQLDDDGSLVRALKEATDVTKRQPGPRGKRVDKNLLRAGEFALEQWGILKKFLQGAAWGRRDVRRLCEKGATEYRDALMTLHAIADEACKGLGLSNPKSFAELHALFRFNVHGTLATFHPDRGRVFPKIHSPTVGLSMRSFSQNVVFHRSPVKISWPSGGDSMFPLAEADIHCLVLPWPRQLDGTAFKIADHNRLKFPSNTFDFFEFDPPNPTEEELETNLEEALKQAERTANDGIDLVILPELALAQEHQEILERVLARHRVSIYIAGIRVPRAAGENFGHNRVAIRRLISKDEGYAGRGHDKHNRWQINSSQIMQYGLKDALELKKTYWEAMRIPKRELAFFSLGPGLVVCPLICEDLARQDSIADAVRAVGPSLIVTILMDGPQERYRWTGRYAGMHSEDPGSAVLTVTSYGMVRRYVDVKRNKGENMDTKASVALWSCPRKTERICCDREDLGTYLRLSWRPGQVVSADCRQNRRHHLTLEEWKTVRQADVATT